MLYINILLNVSLSEYRLIKWNGLIIQWGSFTHSGSKSTITFNTAVPFTQIPLVFAQPQNNKADTYGAVNYICKIMSTSLTGFEARTMRWNGTSVVDSATLTAWFAIGK